MLRVAYVVRCMSISVVLRSDLRGKSEAHSGRLNTVRFASCCFYLDYTHSRSGTGMIGLIDTSDLLLLQQLLLCELHVRGVLGQLGNQPL